MTDPVPSSESPPRPISLRSRAYCLVRPVVRPLAWRLRAFLLGGLQDEMAALRREVEALRAELRQERAALEPRIFAVLEQALLTLALDREQARPGSGEGSGPAPLAPSTPGLGAQSAPRSG